MKAHPAEAMSSYVWVASEQPRGSRREYWVEVADDPDNPHRSGEGRGSIENLHLSDRSSFNRETAERLAADANRLLGLLVLLLLTAGWRPGCMAAKVHGPRCWSQIGLGLVLTFETDNPGGEWRDLCATHRRRPEDLPGFWGHVERGLGGRVILYGELRPRKGAR